ncbi:homocysteine S-methyltransferase [Elsinoe australis]|uniref:Homocysteine S-methyltransferase n=1 Tax=Elsinoe australis TaxID=40998 RepID=A0A4U7BAY2_9PEZI|nr:homocysteine S-methyltransferase [Elsinoe australis]
MPRLYQFSGLTHVVDGGLATALESRGHNLNHPLWSGKLLIEKPEEIQKVHYDFYRAGADIAITASYQTSVLGLKTHLDLDKAAALEVIRSSVRLAQAARDEARQSGMGRTLLVAGSVGPYGAYLANGAEYTGDYANVTEAELREFHRDRIAALLDTSSRADVLACETIPSRLEVQVLCDLLKEHQCSAWVSCTLRDANHISDGTNLAEIVDIVGKCDRVIAFGVNCVPIGLATDALKEIKKVSDSMMLVVYPNSGEKWDAEKKVWYGGEEAREHLGEVAKEWYDAGARLIGGCCRMGYDDIRAISDGLESVRGPDL